MDKGKSIEASRRCRRYIDRFKDNVEASLSDDEFEARFALGEWSRVHMDTRGPMRTAAVEPEVSGKQDGMLLEQDSDVDSQEDEQIVWEGGSITMARTMRMMVGRLMIMMVRFLTSSQRRWIFLVYQEMSPSFRA